MTRNRGLYKPDPTPRHSGLASRLAALPTELIHQVLDDLPLSRIIEVACHNHHTIDHCILTHLVYQRFFTPASLDELRNLFRLYIQISSRRRKYPYPKPISALQRDSKHYRRTVTTTGGKYRREHEVAAGWIAHTKAEIIALLRVYGPYLGTLEKYAPEPNAANPSSSSSSSSSSATTPKTANAPIPRIPKIDGSFASLQSHWRAIDAAESALNAHKSRQLTRLAELLARYPTHLHSHTDSSQESHRNADHAVARLHALTRLMKQPQILSQGFVAKSMFQFSRAPLIPYDRFLKLFIKTLKRYPPRNLASHLSAISAREKKLIQRQRDAARREMEVRLVREEAEQKRLQDAYRTSTKDVYKRTGHNSKLHKTMWEQKKLVFNLRRDLANMPPSVVPAVEQWRAKCPQKRYEYPADVETAIGTVLLGMAYVYTPDCENGAASPSTDDTPPSKSSLATIQPPPHLLLRTLYSPFSANAFSTPAGSHQPTFVMNHDLTHAGNRLPKTKGAQIDALLESELEWLEAFLACCKFMRGMEEPWVMEPGEGKGDGRGKGEGKKKEKEEKEEKEEEKEKEGDKMEVDGETKGTTVAEYWRRHEGV